MKLRITALSLLIVLLAFDRSLALERAEEFAWKCTAEVNSPKEAFGQLHCTSYIGGVLDAYSVISDLHPQAKFICLPETGISTDQAINIFLKWIKAHPDKQHLPVRSAVLMSLSEAFPCRKK